jgi:hypothetical protein
MPIATAAADVAQAVQGSLDLNLGLARQRDCAILSIVGVVAG